MSNLAEQISKSLRTELKKIIIPAELRLCCESASLGLAVDCALWSIIVANLLDSGIILLDFFLLIILTGSLFNLWANTSL